MVSETSYNKAGVDAKLAGKANLPAGGADGQALVKSGSTTAWATVTGGGTVTDATSTAKGVVQLAGDLAGTAAAPTLKALLGAAGTIGSSTQVPVISYDTKGRITAISSVTTSGGSGGGAQVFAPAPLGGTAKDDSNILSTITGNPGKVIFLQPGAVYQIDSLRLPTGTKLDLNGSELRQVNPTGVGGTGAVIRNTGYAEDITTNTDISVVNGTISVGTASSCRPISFQGVTRLRLQNLIVQKRSDATFADFMVSLNCIDDFSVQNVRVTGGTVVGEDGLHLKGCTRGTISDCIVDAGDDALVLVHQFAAKRETSQIAVTNCVLRSAVAHVVRIGVYAGETFPIHQITMSNLTGDVAVGSTSEGVKLHDDTLTGLVRDITWDGLNMDLINEQSNNGFTLQGIVNSAFSNIHIRNAHNRAFDVGAGCTDLSFTDCYGDQRPGNPANSLWVFTSCTKITLTRCTIANSTNHGFTTGGTGIGDLTFIGCRASGSAGANYRLVAVAGLRLIGCVSIGGANAINCDTVSPPSGIIILGGSYSGSSGTLAANMPSDTVRVANAGLTDTITGGTGGATGVAINDAAVASTTTWSSSQMGASFTRYADTAAQADTYPVGTVSVMLKPLSDGSHRQGNTIVGGTNPADTNWVSTGYTIRTIPITQAPVPGNLLISQLTWDKYDPIDSATPPTGWTVIGTQLINLPQTPTYTAGSTALGQGVSSMLAYKVADGTETAVLWAGTARSIYVATVAEYNLQNPQLLQLEQLERSSIANTTPELNPGTATGYGLALGAMSSDNWYDNNVWAPLTLSGGYQISHDARTRGPSLDTNDVATTGSRFDGTPGSIFISKVVNAGDALHCRALCNVSDEQNFRMMVFYADTNTGWAGPEISNRIYESSLTWSPPVGKPVDHYEYAISSASLAALATAAPTLTTATTAAFSGAGIRYARVRSVFTDGTTSAWSTATINAQTIVTSDSFNRADAAAVGTSDAAYGGTALPWIENGGSGWAIKSNALYPNVTNTTSTTSQNVNGLALNASTGDVAVSLKYTGQIGGTYAALVLRGSDELTAYTDMYAVEFAGGNNIQVTKYVSNVVTVLWDAATQSGVTPVYTARVGDKFRFQAKGSTLSLFQNSTLIWTGTDTTWGNTRTYVGFRKSSTISGTTSAFDDVRVHGI